MGITCFTTPTQWFQVFYIRDVVLCTFPSSCARFTEVVHVSQKLCTFHKPPNNVRVQLYTHWAHSNKQKHWGDQHVLPMYICFIYLYFYVSFCLVHVSLGIAPSVTGLLVVAPSQGAHQVDGRPATGLDVVALDVSGDVLLEWDGEGGKVWRGRGWKDGGLGDGYGGGEIRSKIDEHRCH